MKKRSILPPSGSHRWLNCTPSARLEQVEEAKQHCKDPIVLIEQHLDFSCYVPDGFGTGDCIIISDEKLHIVDFKYGMSLMWRS